MCMVGFMFRVCHKHKIFNSIVGFISVDMMNYFFAFKFSTKMFFHNISMVSHRFIGSYINFIVSAVKVYSTCPSIGFITRKYYRKMFICATSRTKVVFFNMRCFAVKWFIANIARKKNLIASTLFRAIFFSRRQGRFNFKRFRTTQTSFSYHFFFLRFMATIARTVNRCIAFFSERLFTNRTDSGLIYS